ncbi:cytochrome oxidase Cu insertion factor (SCO1/SenC/PrrC family) [Rivibacter subsaxonicus]|uniref:Cytochrome oxidase Cu insertion factor (SCO1/SenC/PrrC family) n=2 Tax=Rivibacter subsaxonicus TaxID=457575 RepID=A0A4V2FSR1_9BURK|nr:hypothetical protein [Rivibacter subsaxonicus]RZT95205.1 cytochrome oxidase Cu insertion factor (SCO1/SenC/PrrC family) [Rivibacter subsaxonicus]
MTVHGLQPAVLDEPRDPQAARRGRMKMLLVLLVCAAPVIASYFTYYVIRPQGRVNHGELVEPQRSLPPAAALPLTALDGSPFDAAQLKGQWLLVAVGGGACDAQCEQQLYLQRQLREALGKEKERVDRVWLVDDAAPVRAELLPGLQGATVLRAPPAALAAWLPAAQDDTLRAHFFVVDPLGNLMMRFPAPSDGKKIQRDLGKLLRASAGWDKPGR